MHNNKALCTGGFQYVAPVSKAVEFSAVSVLCSSGVEDDFSFLFDDLEGVDYGEF